LKWLIELSDGIIYSNKSLIYLNSMDCIMKIFLVLLLLSVLSACSATQSSNVRQSAPSSQGDAVTRYADNLLESIPHSAQCSGYRSSIKSIAYSDAPETTRRFKIDKVLSNAANSGCIQ
jgi:hypothetical protein